MDGSFEELGEMIAPCRAAACFLAKRAQKGNPASGGAAVWYDGLGTQYSVPSIPLARIH
jgi:hypothetical protein